MQLVLLIIPNIMKVVIFLFLQTVFVCFTFSGNCQEKKVFKRFVDKWGTDVNNPDTQGYFKMYEQIEGDKYHVELYKYGQTHIISENDVILNRLVEIKDGHCIMYDDSSIIEREGNYKNGQKDGIWTQYYPKSQDVWYIEQYQNGIATGKLKSYYKGHVLKRQEELEGDHITHTGHCYDTAGQEIPFTPFFKTPAGPVNIAEYLSKNVNYPLTAKTLNIGGKVYVRLLIKEDGTLSDIKLIKSIGGGCDEEALRVLSTLPKTGWTRGATDDKSERYMIQGINFKLN